MKIGITGASGLIGSALVPPRGARARRRALRARSGGRRRRATRGPVRGPGSSDPAGHVAGLDAVVTWPVQASPQAVDPRQRKKVVLGQAASTARPPVAAGPGHRAGSGGAAVLHADRLVRDTGRPAHRRERSDGGGFLARRVSSVGGRHRTGPRPPASRGERPCAPASSLSRQGWRARPAAARLQARPRRAARQRQAVGQLDLPAGRGCATRHLLTADVLGPVNLVGPAPVTNKDFTKALGRAVHRPDPAPQGAWPRAQGDARAVRQGGRADRAAARAEGAAGQRFPLLAPDVDSALTAALQER
jgi:hypothetical protein